MSGADELAVGDWVYVTSPAGKFDVGMRCQVVDIDESTDPRLWPIGVVARWYGSDEWACYCADELEPEDHLTTHPAQHLANVHGGGLL